MNYDVSPVTLLESSSKKQVEAELCDGITSKHLEDVESLWRPAKARHRSKLEAAGVPRSQWPQDLHWDWNNKAEATHDKLAIRGFSIVQGNITQGLMYANLIGEARDISEKGKPLVYIDFVEVAPWNRNNFVSPEAKFRGIGGIFLKTAIALSLEEGFKGRIGLHSLPQSRVFYVRCGMTDFGADAAKQNLHYFEMTAAQAQLFL